MSEHDFSFKAPESWADVVLNKMNEQIQSEESVEVPKKNWGREKRAGSPSPALV